MDDNKYIQDICSDAKTASRKCASYTTAEKNVMLQLISTNLKERSDEIVGANAVDVEAAKKAGLSDAMIDRLVLDEKRIAAMVKSVDDISDLDDPVGRIERMTVRPSGISVGQMRVPLGVVAVIYESRPNVTVDVASLCIKSGNAVILRGGKEAVNTNSILYKIISDSIKHAGLDNNIVRFVDKIDRSLASYMLKMNRYIDIVVARGGEGLIEMVTRESTIPVIKHDKGICHVFIDESADELMANRIAINAKVQRPGVCNAMESLLIHSKYPHKASIIEALADHKVELRGCEKTLKISDKIKPAAAEDWDTEYLDLILSVKIVDSLEDAIDHIALHGSGHSEAIITESYRNAQKFLSEVDASAVLVNASTRLHDGGEFGLGAEVGISTQKLHARGTMGLLGLTSLKYVVYGHGEVR